MKEKIFKNFTLKVLSVLCAIVLWTIIVNIYDPTTSVTVSNVNVQLINAESLTNQGYAYEVVDGSKIAVYISGPKSIITDIKSSDIVATADLSKITAFADYVDIDVKVVKDGRTISNIEVAPRTTAVKLDIENRETKEFVVQTEVTGSPASGYMVLNRSVTPSSIKITGPGSEVAAIDKVKAVCDISGIKASTNKKAGIVLYDVNGNEITSDKLVLSVTEVEYVLTVGVTKTVSVKCAGTEGRVADGYMFVSAEPSVSQVTLAASDSSLLDSITDITIPKSAVSVSGLKESTAISIDLAGYVPSGVKFISSSTIDVNVTIEPRVNKHITIQTSSIKVNNLKEGLNAVISGENEVSITVSGNGSSISKVTAGNITASVDLSNLEEGTHSVTLNVSANVDCKIEGDYKVLVVITGNTEESSSASTETRESSDAQR